MEKKKTEKIFLILAFLGIYLLSTGISYAAFNFLRKEHEKFNGRGRSPNRK